MGDVKRKIELVFFRSKFIGLRQGCSLSFRVNHSSASRNFFHRRESERAHRPVPGVSALTRLSHSYTHTQHSVVARDTAAPKLAPSTASSTRHGRLRGIDRLESARLPLESVARHVVSCAWVQAASVGELRVRRLGAESARRSGCEARTAHRAPTSNSDQLAGPRPRESS
jgi:hypothetical protein